MQNTSELFKTILKNPRCVVQNKVTIAGKDYLDDKIESLSTSGSMFSSAGPCIGSAVSRTIEVTLKTEGASIPRAAEIKVFIRLALLDSAGTVTSASEWIPKGIFYIDTREPDEEDVFLTIHGYDAMLKGEQAFLDQANGETDLWPQSMSDVALACGEKMGVQIDARTSISSVYEINYPNDYTCRELLQHIAAAHCGNWIITDAGKLRLVPLGDLSEADSVQIGQSVEDFSSPPAFSEFSRVTLLVDDETYYTSGTDTGRELEADCPWATQDICNAVLAKVKGYKYVPYTADNAIPDPSAEIGDSVSVNGKFSVIAKIEAVFDSLYTATVAAPADEELDHEYPYQSGTVRKLDRKLAQTRAAITVKADQIMAQVESELNDLSSSFSVQLESITSTVQGLDGAVSSIEQKVNSIKIGVTTKDGVSTIELTGTGITASSAKIDLSGYVTFTGLSGGTTTIDGACIKTGTISADRINLTGAITWSDLSKSVQNEFGDGLTEDDVSTLITSELVSSPNIAGGKFKDIKQKNWIEMGQVQTSGGKTTVAYFNHYCSGYSTSNPVFVMGYTNPTTAAANWVMAPFNTIVLDYLKTNETMYASGNWDFSGANVSGLGIDADGVKVVPVWG